MIAANLLSVSLAAYVSVTEPISRLASCRVEFGTGFSTPETGAQKGT